MVILKYIIYIILTFVFLFILAGLLTSTIHYGHEVTINKPIREVWAVHQDPTKLGKWIKGFESIDLINGAQGEIRSTYKVLVNPGEGQLIFEMIQTIDSKKEFDHIGLSFDSEMMVFDQKTTFLEVDGKTVLKTQSEVSGKGIIMRSMFAVMDLFSNSFKKQEVENIENLKKLIEANTTIY